MLFDGMEVHLIWTVVIHFLFHEFRAKGKYCEGLSGAFLGCKYRIHPFSRQTQGKHLKKKKNKSITKYLAFDLTEMIKVLCLLCISAREGCL